MNIKPLNIVYGFFTINVLIGILVVFFPDKPESRYIYGIVAFISILIILGLRDRNDFMRRFAIWYLIFVAFVNTMVILVGVPYSLVKGETISYGNTAYTLALVLASIYMVRGLNADTLLTEFTSNKSLNTDAPR